MPRQQLLRPFPQFATITEDRRSLGVNDYNALQVSLNKRLARGLQFLVSYTFSRTEEAITYLNPQDDWSGLSGVVTAADTPHRLLVSARISSRSSRAAATCSARCSAAGR